MKKYLFLLIFFLSIITTSSYAYLVTNTIAQDSVKLQHPLVLKDSVRTADSIKIFRKHKIIKTAKMIVLGGLAGGSAYGSVLFGLDTNGYPMLFLGLFCLAMVFSIFRIKKKKPKTYEELKQKESEPLIKKDPKFNKSWNFAFYIGLLSFLMTVLSFFTGISLFSLFLPLFLASLVFFVLGFKGKYSSPKKFASKLILGFMGLFLQWLPYIIILIYFVR